MQNVKLETHVLPDGNEIKVQSKPASATQYFDKSTTSMGKSIVDHRFTRPAKGRTHK